MATTAAATTTATVPAPATTVLRSMTFLRQNTVAQVTRRRAARPEVPQARSRLYQATMQQFVSPGNETAHEIKTTLDISSSAFVTFFFRLLSALVICLLFIFLLPFFSSALYPYQIYARLFPCKLATHSIWTEHGVVRVRSPSRCWCGLFFHLIFPMLCSCCSKSACSSYTAFPARPGPFSRSYFPF